jgi:hypothetical protein
MTGWLPEVGEMLGCWQACRSRIGSEIGRRDLGGREGLGGLVMTRGCNGGIRVQHPKKCVRDVKDVCFYMLKTPRIAF